ncbi:hypothetical protein MPTK1_7g08230 [Marchantia polymorpha subsp. ruderalis]|uniref:Uncharacterized protein n=2 Tax=Marchantia polymorpha TaxID=3197 RepID=A0AAF6BXC0_MARPO|nr:hypothetical protein MARPO_0146s0023 [Marchantia polymorpha]BBN16654.1 hypothetical protein Mp_7g08230 [Marchantia polymorpha subsp. ruderalis]|eukprot:PTQ29201.1 hypothetical protein MARPO_0146s0023 [Marchantia polymorpha]
MHPSTTSSNSAVALVRSYEPARLPHYPTTHGSGEARFMETAWPPALVRSTGSFGRPVWAPELLNELDLPADAQTDEHSCLYVGPHSGLSLFCSGFGLDEDQESKPAL